MRRPPACAFFTSQNNGDKTPMPKLSALPSSLTFPAKLRHGSFLPITEAEYNRINSLVQP
jgi:hypothetical protein